jgi:pimeloyl-ACP methyl ester carboxylesterase
MRRRFLLVAGAIFAGLVVGFSLSVLQAGGWEGWLARRGIVPEYAALGRAVPALEGRRVYLDCRGSGSPTVVLEAGIGSDARSWGSVFPTLARETRTCAYSRANRWGSDPRGTHTVAEAAADLQGALAAAGEQAPFVLVGHSLGDVYVRVLAGRYPGEVAGLVLVDPFGPDRFRRLIARASPDLARAIPDAERAGLAQEWRDGIEAISGRVRLTLAPGSSHMIQWDRPDLVVAAVGRLVQTVRGQ